MNPTLPSANVTASSQAKVGVKLRSLLDADGFNAVKVVGYEHNWDGAAAYATDLVRTRQCDISLRCIRFSYVASMDLIDA